MCIASYSLITAQTQVQWNNHPRIFICISRLNTQRGLTGSQLLFETEQPINLTNTFLKRQFKKSSSWTQRCQYCHSFALTWGHPPCSLRADAPSCTAGQDYRRAKSPHLPTLQLAQPHLSTTSPNWSDLLGTASLLNQRGNPQSDCILHSMPYMGSFGPDHFHAKQS